jgi:hypothetical protein
VSVRGTSHAERSPAEIQQAVDAAYGKFRTLNEGKNADYIPALAKVDPNLFGIVLITTDGKVYTAGDVRPRYRSRINLSSNRAPTTPSAFSSCSVRAFKTT